MNKERLVKKYLPVQPYDMAGLEAWFSQMAAQGLHLVKADVERAHFRPGPPKTGVRYALDVTGFYDIDRERNENYAQMGWDYVTTLKLSLMVSMYYVYRSEDGAVPALHTDPVTQSTTVVKLIRRLRRTLIFMVILLAILFRNELSALFADPWSAPRFFLLRTEQAALWLALMIPYVLMMLIPFCHKLWGLGKVRRQLAAGIPLERETRRRRIPASLYTWGLVALAAVCVAIILYLEPIQSRRLSGPEEWAFPHVTLAQALEGTEVGPLALESPYDKMLHPDTFRTSFLCPEQYSWDQWGASRTPGGARETGLSLEFYRARSPEAAQLLMTCLESAYNKELSNFEKRQDGLVNGSTFTLRTDFQIVPAQGLDSLRTMEYQIDAAPVTTCWLGQRGDQAFLLVCRGIPDPERVLELLTAQLD